jgi:hypothetical protein
VALSAHGITSARKAVFSLTTSLYNAEGTLFTAPISGAVLQVVGWVIAYEQTKMLCLALPLAG